MAVYPVGDAAADRTLCSSGRSADEEGEMMLADLQTLQFEALFAEDKCLVDLHAALPLTPRSTKETVTIDKAVLHTVGTGHRDCGRALTVASAVKLCLLSST